MSGGFSSLLDQFKRITEQDAVAAIVVDGGKGSGDGVRHTSTTSLRRKIDEDGYYGNQDSKKRTRHTSTSHTTTTTTTTTTTIYQRPTVPVQTIYIACPANIETGGPEALHQLCHVINNIGKEDTTTMPRAFMLYLRERNNNSGTNSKGGMSRIMEHVISTTACPTRYARYDAPPAPNLPGHNHHNNNNSNNKLISSSSATNHEVIHSSEMVVWPECWTHLIDTLLPPPLPPGEQTTTTTNVVLPYQNAIWWLSVDNNKGSFTTKDFVERRDVLHLVQSAYAYNYVTSHLRHRKEEENMNDGGRRRVNMSHHHPDVITLTEYIYQYSPLSNKLADENVDTTTSSAVIANTPSQQPTLLRDIDVVYNPAKGIHYTNEIIRRAGQTLQIVPIGKGLNGQVRMTNHEVTNLLRRAKVYIDFGPHPGMDRLPREAALAGCIVITNRDGAAGYDVDVPLPNEFKFGGTFCVDNVYTLLRDICISISSSHDSKNINNNEEEEKLLTRYEVYVNKMKPYVDWIHGQERRMKDCVDRFIHEVVTLRQMC